MMKTSSSQKSIFITRDLATNDPIAKWANEHSVQLYYESLIEFKAVEINTLPNADWIFFYSKNGVKYFFEQVETSSLRVDIQYAAMGTATAQAISKYNKDVTLIGNGVPQDVAKQLLKATHTNHQICFAQAEYSKKSVANLIRDKRKITEVVCYDNRKKDVVQIPKTDWCILTSPLNAEVFISNCDKRKNIISLGATTQGHIMTQFGIESIIPKSPNMASIVELLNELEI